MRLRSGLAISMCLAAFGAGTGCLHEKTQTAQAPAATQAANTTEPSMSGPTPQTSDSAGRSAYRASETPEPIAAPPPPTPPPPASPPAGIGGGPDENHAAAPSKGTGLGGGPTASGDNRFQDAQNAALERVPGQIQVGRLHHPQGGSDYYNFIIAGSNGAHQLVTVDAESSEVRSVKPSSSKKSGAHGKGVGGGPAQKCAPGESPK